MSSKAARREYLQAVAEFERGCREFSAGMQRILGPSDDGTDPALQFIVSELGERRPATRAPSVAPMRRRQEG